MKLEVKRPEQTVQFCLDGALYAQYATAEEELKEARKKDLATKDSRLNSTTTKLARELVELRGRIQQESVSFLMRGMNRKEWATLTAENPPREGSAVDKPYGFNVEAVIDTAIPRSIVSVTKDGEPVEFDPAKDWDETADEMTDRQYEDFGMAVIALNRGRQEVPFSLDAYRRIQDSAAT
ncbi:hypothetical protein FJV46_10700 [Arthrobacter agilis]|uniref:hypothetical protein n=1 Tax=Arthrobacter agilis TaxID=37921 RepID=UPI000B35DACD|nr:hypothetical protein [Arthrobacter agilis]OUM44155.1 hypothetical protein B8W74_04585 [Arthrobacter agilis]PPB46531.1 hypothetical protein CI784_06880 [Arthrobacter agilis]TPV23813.1 hypothetical protein FJV46_10700 [Arthrobacter agilis]VDR32547.1 Uncharacterised protein [Arthrobacter agilis]